MDEKKRHTKQEELSDEQLKNERPPSLDPFNTFTDKKRKREEIDNSTIGGF